MKKITFLMLALVSLQLFSQEQFNIGINGGIPIDKVESASNIAFGADVNYLFDLHEAIVVGPSVGLIYFNPQDQDVVVGGVETTIKIDAPIFIPLSAAFYFHSADDKFYVGGELGYALSASDVDGGFFIKPTIGYHLSDPLKLNLFYAGVKTKTPTSYAYIGLGLTFDLKGGNSQYAY